MSSARLRKLLSPLLRHVASGKKLTFRDKSAAQQGLYLLGKPSTRSKKPAEKRKQEKRAAHAMSTKAIREAVMARAGGRCENQYERFWPHSSHQLVLDHWLGGAGRRRQKQSVATTWAICVPCNRERTANLPSAAYWNAAFREHCAKHGYPFAPHIEHQPLPTRSGPEAAPPPSLSPDPLRGGES